MQQQATPVAIPLTDTTFEQRSAEFHHRMAVQFMEQQPIGARAARMSAGRAIARIHRHNAACLTDVDYSQDVPFESVERAVRGALESEAPMATVYAFSFNGDPTSLTGKHAAILVAVRGGLR